MRTGAASAISAKYLARPESCTIGILACGVQGHTNLEAMNVVFPLKKVLAFDSKADKAKKLAEYAQSNLGLEVEIVQDPRKAVTGCDIVVTSGPILKKPHETIQAGWLDKGAFASCVDFDSYWSRDALKEAALPVKTIIGGAPVTQTFADQIGADGYRDDAPGGVELVRKLVGA